MQFLSIVISIIALVLSYVAFFMQFFHKKTAILGTLLGIGYDLSEKDYERSFNYSISNLGNQEILLNKVLFLEGTSAKGRAHDIYRQHKDKCMSSCSVIKPGEIKTITVFAKRIQPQFKIKRIKSENKIIWPRKDDSEKEATPNPIYFIAFELISIKGKNYEILHDITNSFSFKSKDEEKAMWIPFTLKNACK